MMSTKSEFLEVTRVTEYAAKRIYLIGKGKHRTFARFQHINVRKNTSVKQSDRPKDLDERQWQERYLLFSKFDEGIRLNETGWSVTTHEKIAKKIAKICPASVVIDAFCGVGGNSIQFARKYKVIAVDIDKEKVECAEHNANIYAVSDNIEFVNADFLQVAAQYKADVVFLAPDMQINASGFDLFSHVSPPVRETLQAALRCADHLMLYLPPNFDPDQIAQLVSETEALEIAVDFSLFFYGSNLMATTCMLSRKSPLDFETMCSLLISRLKCNFDKAVMKKVIAALGLRVCIELLTEVENFVTTSQSLLLEERLVMGEVFLDLVRQKGLCDLEEIAEEHDEDRDQFSPTFN
jgi:trimethylguanosine synthase